MSVPFTDVDISVNQDLWSQVVEQTKTNFVPTVFVRHGETEEGDIYIPEKDFKSEDELIESLKKYL